MGSHGISSPVGPLWLPWASIGDLLASMRLPWAPVGTHERPLAPIGAHGSYAGAHGSSVGVHGPWNFIRVRGCLWVSHGLPWAQIDVNGFPWASMGAHGSPWLSRGRPWILCGLLWSSIGDP